MRCNDESLLEPVLGLVVPRHPRVYIKSLASTVGETPELDITLTITGGGAAERVELLGAAYEDLSKGLDEQGFTFFGNYESAKGEQLAARPFAAMTFFWPGLERQVRIEGRVERLSSEESAAYYQQRPLGSRLGAWASPQSRVVADRSALQQLVAVTEARFAGQEPPCPPHWGGYRLLPDRLEFWQGRPSRLHDRLNYRLNDGQWLRERLAP